jgi:hypothetical protein
MVDIRLEGRRQLNPVPTCVEDLDPHGLGQRNLFVQVLFQFTAVHGYSSVRKNLGLGGRAPEGR